MIEFTQQTLRDYLYHAGHLPPGTMAQVEPLAWGVSNMVFRVHPEVGEDFVVKQSRKQLRTQAAWFSRLERIHTEMDLMRHLAKVVPAGSIPRVLFEDRPNFLFGMEAVPADHRVWKADLLAGVTEPAIARQAGQLLATIHRETAGDADLLSRFGDRTVFDELRVDPFYRYVLRQHPGLAPALERVIDQVLSLKICVVHADFSPKNLLLSQAGLTLVDFETGHFGDPAFDLGFFLSHLVLKTIKHADHRESYLALIHTFWAAYTEELSSLMGQPSSGFHRKDLERRILGNLAGCLLARIDGKSPIDYFDQPWQKASARALAITYLMQPVTEIAQALAEIEKILPRREAAS